MNLFDPSAARKHFLESFDTIALKDQTEHKLRAFIVAAYAAGMSNACEQAGHWVRALQDGEMTVGELQDRISQLWASAADEALAQVPK